MKNETKKVVVDGKRVELTRVQGYNGNGLPRSVIQKFVPAGELEGLGKFLRSRHLTVAFTTGVYDMIHAGHKRYLELAAKMGDVLVVGLNSDKSVKKLKGPGRPILGEEQRLEMLCALGCVDYVTIYDETDGAKTIKALKPDAYLCVEGSWQGDIVSKAEVKTMAKHGGKVFYAPRQSPTLSTTAILESIEKLQRVKIIDELKLEMSSIHAKKK
jgi:rfaE bifunctional protein nucleotidyltransferase chain/domain